MFGKLPSPIYDTQIAAMVCGYGDQISYEHLVFDLLNIKIDKSSRVSNWSYRPLSNKQISYALSDVTHLVDLFRILKKKIFENGREKWIEEDMNNLSNIENYKLKPDEAWKKIKYKSFKSEYMNRLKFLAEWREHLSINRNVTKNKIARDEVLLEIASNDPKDINDFSRIRGLKLDKNKNILLEILQTLEKARDVPKELWPTKKISKKNKINKPAVLELLKVLLKHVSEENKVAPKLIAKQIDLEIIASGDKNNIKIFQGWRYEIFGKLVENLIEGKIAIKIQNGKLLILNNI
jgi:ribonuclease D